MDSKPARLLARKECNRQRTRTLFNHAGIKQPLSTDLD